MIKMDNKIIVGIGALVVIVAVIGFLNMGGFFSGGESSEESKSKASVTTSTLESNDTQPSTENMTTKKLYTLEEVAKHNSREDCWMVIHGKVYDVTSYIPLHPGGETILQGCGKDATELFETRPMGSGTPHSQNAREFLENYYVGDLKE